MMKALVAVVLLAIVLLFAGPGFTNPTTIIQAMNGCSGYKEMTSVWAPQWGNINAYYKLKETASGTAPGETHLNPRQKGDLRT